MRIVFLSWWWPYPPTNGSKIRIYHLLRHLAQRHDVDLLSFAEPDEATSEQIAHLRSFCQRVEVVPKPVFNPGALKATLGYLSRWPRLLVDVYSPEMANKVRAAAGHGPVDVVIASELQMLRYLELLTTSAKVLEEIEVTTFHDQVNTAVAQTSQFRARLTLTKLEGVLASLMAGGVAMTVVSQSERRLIQQFAPADAQIEVIPNGFDTREYRPLPNTSVTPHSLVYTGAVTYSANLDAVTWFIQECWPLIRARYPEATFTITGGTGDVDVRHLAAVPGVRFTGFLPSVAPIAQQSRALVVPLRQGGGTRLKILEALALGVPVIATPKGIEGIEAIHKRDVLIASTPTELADSVAQLFDDDILRSQLAANGRALVERQYDWSIIADRLNALVESLAAGQPVADSGRVRTL